MKIKNIFALIAMWILLNAFGVWDEIWMEIEPYINQFLNADVLDTLGLSNVAKAATTATTSAAGAGEEPSKFMVAGAIVIITGVIMISAKALVGRKPSKKSKSGEFTFTAREV